ncbi:MAG: hypothetical protein KAT69_02225 [Candidatus Aminicenantes bacterium]|nr:hypothetical protein [Candidatus Aminicenantes bacterium]
MSFECKHGWIMTEKGDCPHCRNENRPYSRGFHDFIVGLIIIILFLIGASDLLAAEKDYQQEYCKGIMEFRLPDRTRVDCLTEDHAIEFDFGKKWAEAVGQSLHYAAHTGRRAGIVLITWSR